MERFKDLLRLRYNDIIIFLAGLILAIAPFVVDYTTLPKGFELPKVLFLQIGGLLLIALGFTKFAYKLAYRKAGKFKFSWWILALVVGFLVLSTLLSPFPEIALWGNSFRLQGVITHLILILAAFSVYNAISFTNWHVLAILFISSTIVQSLIAVTQFMELVRINPDMVLEGLWVNGTFGQANWFAGRLLVAIILSALYLGLKLNKSFKVRILFKAYFLVILILFITVLGLTYSTWGIISAAVAVLMVILYEILPKKIFLSLVAIGVIASIIFTIIFLRVNTDYNLRLEIINSIFIIFSQPFDLQQLKIYLFGFGFDTLGEVLKSYRMIPGLLVDRAHNFFLDVLIQNGIVILGLLIGIIINIFRKELFKNKNRIVDFTFILVIAWIFRSVIHENGVVNLFDFLIFFAVLTALSARKLH